MNMAVGFMYQKLFNDVIENHKGFEILIVIRKPHTIRPRSGFLYNLIIMNLLHGFDCVKKQFLE